MSFLNPKKDKYGEKIFPGDVCAARIDNRLQLIVYKGESWGGENSKGEFGQFVTTSGVRSIKYTSVIFVFDPVSSRRSKATETTAAIRKYYEGKD